jgi:hypothetical protein
MKTITLELSEDVANRLLAMDDQKRSLMLKFITSMEARGQWKELFIKTAEQAAKQGLTEDILKDLLKKE